MGTVTTGDGIEIYYKDWGKGQPIVFSHGWPLSADDWDAQMLFFLNHGYRVIAHDRRGHGRSIPARTSAANKGFIGDGAVASYLNSKGDNHETYGNGTSLSVSALQHLRICPHSWSRVGRQDPSHV